MKKFKTSTGENNCVEIKKTRNAIIWLGVGMIAMAYFFLIPSANQLKDIQKQVQPTVSLYSNPKSLQGKFPLIDDNRNTTSLSVAANSKWSILYFGYTSCPDVCPIDLAILNQTLGMMQQADKLQVIFISVDPKRDVGNLNAFTGRFNAGFIGLSAEESVLRNMTKTLGVYHEVEKTKQRALAEDQNKPKDMSMVMNNNYLINHTASYLLLNPSLELTGLLTNPHYAPKMAKALDLIIETLD
ncbi:MAG: SCO family protein [Candidatus Thioglobus sp.]|nr:MAG: SCO family protein [Candidatus Thioglobus sp.]RUM77749.1 MAG: SCO family protein [Candidatus Thioglobus sp.]RUM80035.1 MAG: SCO family protein [Candidatus Thioglobus sp.]RUM83797.1 MAG: SCO family protein [Candidatus Thioglobus sp.]